MKLWILDCSFVRLRPENSLFSTVSSVVVLEVTTITLLRVLFIHMQFSLADLFECPISIMQQTLLILVSPCLFTYWRSALPSNLNTRLKLTHSLMQAFQAPDISIPALLILLINVDSCVDIVLHYMCIVSSTCITMPLYFVSRLHFVSSRLFVSPCLFTLYHLVYLKHHVSSLFCFVVSVTSVQYLCYFLCRFFMWQSSNVLMLCLCNFLRMPRWTEVAWIQW